MHYILASRVALRSRARGEQASDWELGVAMREIRRSISLEFVRAVALCLLARGCLLEAVKWRVQVEREVETGRRVERAHFAANVRGRGRRKVGDIHPVNCKLSAVVFYCLTLTFS